MGIEHSTYTGSMWYNMPKAYSWAYFSQAEQAALDQRPTNRRMRLLLSTDGILNTLHG